MCVWACVCFVNSVSRRLRVPLFPLYLFICWGCWFPVQLFSIRANLFLSIYTTKHAHAHAFCGPPPHKLLSLIMRRSGILWYGLLLRLGTGHSGRRGQSCYGCPAGSGSSGSVIDPGPDEQIAARLDVTVFLSPWASDRSSDGSSNQTACVAGEDRGHEC